MHRSCRLLDLEALIPLAFFPYTAGTSLLHIWTRAFLQVSLLISEVTGSGFTGLSLGSVKGKQRKSPLV